MKVLVPFKFKNQYLSEVEIKDISFVGYDRENPIPDEHKDAEILITYMMSSEAKKRAAEKLKNVQFVQGLSAGQGANINAGFDEEVIICSGSGTNSIPVSEHALAFILGTAIRIHLLRDAQKERRWASELRSFKVCPKDEFRMIYGSNIVVWGVGNIGTRVGKVLQEFGANVQGIDLQAGINEGIPVYEVKDIESIFSDAHALVMCLPGTPETEKILNEERIGYLPEHAWIVNTGRGTTIDQKALVRALENKEIAGAALDVFEEEPLPNDSPLWDLENAIITPHSAGGRYVDAGQFVKKQIKRFIEGKPLENVVDRERGF